MEHFLKLVATDLYAKKGKDLARTVLIFPNKRAHLFFNEHLAPLSPTPIWSPIGMSISELFGQLTPLQPADPIRLVCELHRIFGELTGNQKETLDEFYFWGELLIADFDDVDKNLAEAKQLFSNLQDFKNLLGGTSFLEPEQEEAIRRFFLNFSADKRTELKDRFISLWDKLGGIYVRFKERLRTENIAYEGMLYRDAVERLSIDSLPHETYVFVGFNVLNKVEEKLFTLLHQAGKALFYWDYDLYYTERIPNHEAGEFIRRNLARFPNQLPASYFDNLLRPKQVTYISSPTEYAQTRYLPQWLKQATEQPHLERENAVVLCNESLLLPVIHALPPEVEHVNITMGFPLSQTPICSFVNAALFLQTEGYRPKSGRFFHKAVLSILKHPYVQQLSPTAEGLVRELTMHNRFFPLPSELQQDPFLTKVFTPQTTTAQLCTYLIDLIQEVATLYRQKETEEEEMLDQLYRESLFKAFTALNRLGSLMDEGLLTINSLTLRRLIGKLMSGTNIPFHGEPIMGIQIMGVLETRNLDFRNLVLLSLNEGLLPKGSNDASFIPHVLRAAYGLTTMEHRNAVYAYYFYRLMQRAENVTLMYNTSSDGLNRGEESRFMLQWLVEGGQNIVKQYLDAGQTPRLSAPIAIQKTEEMMQSLRSMFDATQPDARLLSPSALNTYLDCPLRFYYRYPARLKETQEVNEEIDAALFGSIFHLAAQRIYQELTSRGPMVSTSDIDTLLKDNNRLQSFVDDAFKELFFQVDKNTKPEYNGTQLINSRVIASYLKQLLVHDRAYAPFEMLAMELDVSEEVIIGGEEIAPIKLRLGGTIDRIDRKGNRLRIVDYKTGGSPHSPNQVEDLFIPAEKRPNYVFQTFLYAAIIKGKNRPEEICPSIFYIHKAASQSYSPEILMGEPRKREPVTDFTPYESEFRERLYDLLEEIFDPRTPFGQTPFTGQCAYCEFQAICRRG